MEDGDDKSIFQTRFSYREMPNEIWCLVWPEPARPETFVWTMECPCIPLNCSSITQNVVTPLLTARSLVSLFYRMFLTPVGMFLVPLEFHLKSLTRLSHREVMGMMHTLELRGPMCNESSFCLLCRLLLVSKYMNGPTISKEKLDQNKQHSNLGRNIKFARHMPRACQITSNVLLTLILCMLRHLFWKICNGPQFKHHFRAFVFEKEQRKRTQATLWARTVA